MFNTINVLMGTSGERKRIPLELRIQRQVALDEGYLPLFLVETQSIKAIKRF
jgi:hypothetical protein